MRSPRGPLHPSDPKIRDAAEQLIAGANVANQVQPAPAGPWPTTSATGPFPPTSSWERNFLEPLAERISLSSGGSLHGIDYNEGLRLVFRYLGWDGN